MAKGVQAKTLQKKCNVWAKRLRLRDWTITCRYATKADMEKEDPDDDYEPSFDSETIGRLQECSVPEKIALILIRRDYFDHTGHKVSWNIDTLILHELIHIIEKIGKTHAGLNKNVGARKDYWRLEEFNCDTFSAIVYFLYYDQI